MPTTGIGNYVENKDELVSHNFDIFSNGSIEKAMEKGYEQEIYPTAGLNDDGPFEFYIPHARITLYYLKQDYILKEE